MMERNTYLSFDFKKNWEYIKPHLTNKRLLRILDYHMIRYTKQYPRKGVKWSRKNGPWYLTPSDYWWCEEDVTEPEPGTYQWYQAFHMCHWLAPWLRELGKLVYPHLEWSIEGDDHHSIAVGRGNGEAVIFDILTFELE